MTQGQFPVKSTRKQHKVLRNTHGCGKTFDDLYTRLHEYLANHTVFKEFMLEAAPFTTTFIPTTQKINIKQNYKYQCHNYTLSFSFLLTRTVTPGWFGIFADSIMWDFYMDEIVEGDLENLNISQIRSDWSNLFWSSSTDQNTPSTNLKLKIKTVKLTL